MGIIQPDLGALYRSIAKEIATLALALATTTTTTKEKPEYEDMVKHYIVASVLLGSMLAGHAHAVTAPHDAGLRKLQQDNYGDQYDPYGVDTDDDYYSSNDGYFYAYPDSYDDDYGDQYDAYGVDYDDDYYASNDGYFYRYPIGAGYEPSTPSFDSVVDSAVAAGGNAASEYIDNDCTGNSVADHTCQLLGGGGALNEQISDGIQDTIVSGVSGVSSLFGRKLLQDNYGDQNDVVDTVVDTAGNIVSNTATSAIESATFGLFGGK